MFVVSQGLSMNFKAVAAEPGSFQGKKKAQEGLTECRAAQ
jgi:hypothetical protein